MVCPSLRAISDLIMPLARLVPSDMAAVHHRLSGTGILFFRNLPRAFTPERRFSPRDFRNPRRVRGTGRECVSDLRSQQAVYSQEHRSRTSTTRRLVPALAAGQALSGARCGDQGRWHAITFSARKPIHSRGNRSNACNPTGIDSALDRNRIIVQHMALYDMALGDIYGIFTPD
jgi:hypothetical protein